LVDNARRADDEGAAAVRRSVALVDLDRMRRAHRAGCGAGEADEGSAVGRSVALRHARSGGRRGKWVAARRDPAAGPDALVDRAGRRVRAHPNPRVRHPHAAAERAAPAIDRIVALGDPGHEAAHEPDLRLAAGLRMAGGAMALAHG